MTLVVAAITAMAVFLGVFAPTRWHVFGFLSAALLLFVTQAALNTFGGYAGTSLEESLLLFNGSYASYIGFNLQITYRAFALPLLVLGSVTIYRFSLRRD